MEYLPGTRESSDETRIALLEMSMCYMAKDIQRLERKIEDLLEKFDKKYDKLMCSKG